jgi:hypothetical protein
MSTLWNRVCRSLIVIVASPLWLLLSIAVALVVIWGKKEEVEDEGVY